ncbi:dihydrofolate reductase family protein [Schumannella luteola]|uniref:Dihydrofolate reductase n=1 Tax=Schumannella luteola TaxID=472059 RepID=A0A852YEI0_9MICO|nr:dihydrofolate reductase family protein [Schumannella luteola]NYG99710.1 dihydrofolate reductase [Schumannella luteola]TPX06492.1 reductase [Schumannella luteola]
MSGLIVEQIVSADGKAVDDEGGMSFMGVADPSEVDTDQLIMLERVDAILMGRRTYEMFAGFWPNETVESQPAAGPMNSLPKHVVSSTLTAAPWGSHAPAQVETGDGVEIARRLLDQYSGAVIVWGSLTLTDSLFRADLVDTVRFRTLPVVIGGGRPVTPPGLAMLPLTHVSTRAYPAGQITTEYRVRRV